MMPAASLGSEHRNGSADLPSPAEPLAALQRLLATADRNWAAFRLLACA